MISGWLSPLIVDVLGGRQKFQILHEIHTNGPMSVQELQERLAMSYMGVKQHCDSLEEGGFLVVEKHVLGQGRPRHVFGLSARGREVFAPQVSDLADDLMRAVEKIHGKAGAEKILYRVYQDRAEEIFRRVERFALLRRARELASIRRSQGYETRVERTKDHLLIIESDKPIRSLIERYPLVAMLERALYERVLGVKVLRAETETDGIRSVRFLVVTQNELSATSKPKPKLTGKKRRPPELVAPTSSPSSARDNTKRVEQKATKLAVITEKQPVRESLQLDLVDYINSLGKESAP